MMVVTETGEHRGDAVGCRLRIELESPRIVFVVLVPRRESGSAFDTHGRR
jgi:hypothetical protein